MSYSNPPKITQEELSAAQSCIFFSPNRLADGRGNMVPEAAVAILRGARYDTNGPLFRSDMIITDKAMRDLADFLGFDGPISYNNALMIEGNKIFQRAQFKQIPLPESFPVNATYPFPIFIKNGVKQTIPDSQAGESIGTPRRGKRERGDFIDFSTAFGGETFDRFITDHGNEGQTG